jgi:membrane protease YdiL (CAAX protease family)
VYESVQPIRAPARPLSPLAVYFVLAFAITWGWEVPVFSGLVPPGPWSLLGPSVAGIVTAAAAGGRAGILQLLKRIVAWRAGWQWYAVALLLIPAIYVTDILFLPGGLAALRNLPLTALASTFLSGMWPAALSALFWEEIGWRGFAQPLMQDRFGPLRGTLLLGLLWGLWHLPLWAFNPSVSNNLGAAWPGILAAYALYVGSVISYSVFMAWVLNHAQGSVLLAVLLHASINASIGAFQAHIPALFPPVVECTEIVVAALLLVATRLRLGYPSAD